MHLMLTFAAVEVLHGALNMYPLAERKQFNTAMLYCSARANQT